MTICHGLLQYTTHIFSSQSKSNELREAREVFFQWLSGHSQTGKWLMDLYEICYGNSIAFIVHSLDRSLFTRLIAIRSVAG